LLGTQKKTTFPNSGERKQFLVEKRWQKSFKGKEKVLDRKGETDSAFRRKKKEGWTTKKINFMPWLTTSRLRCWGLYPKGKKGGTIDKKARRR